MVLPAARHRHHDAYGRATQLHRPPALYAHWPLGAIAPASANGNRLGCALLLYRLVGGHGIGRRVNFAGRTRFLLASWPIFRSQPRRHYLYGASISNIYATVLRLTIQSAQPCIRKYYTNTAHSIN